jgi:hypothetical protein
MGEEIAKALLAVILFVLACIGSAAALGTWAALVVIFGKNVYRWLT